LRTISLLVALPAALGAAEIPQGAHVLLRMMNSVSTRTARAGDSVYLQTVSPIAAAGRIIVPAGSYVNGTVAEAKRSGRVTGRAEIAIRIDTLTLPSGTVAKISPHLASVDSENSDQRVVGKENNIQQGGSKMHDLGRIAILAGAGAAIGGTADRSWQGAGIGAATGGAVGLATVLLTRGREVELRAGSTFDVVFDRPITLE
jgi:type IV secretion system protein VirB10